jgi:hypothetical protein
MISFFIFTSCAQRMKVPINRFVSPEAIGGGAQVEYRDMTFSSGVLDFSNNSTTNPLVMGTAREEEFYLGIGVSNNADVFVRVPKESSSLLGIKIQLIGSSAKEAAVGHNLAFSMGMGSERDKFEQSFTIDLKSDVTDFSLIHGYRLAPMLLIYDGISISNYSFEGTVSGATGLNSNDIDYAAKNIQGGHLGVILGGKGLKLKLEYAAQKITWTHTESKLFQSFGVALTAGW